MKLKITPPLQIVSILSVLIFNCNFLLAQVEVGTNNKVSIGPYTPISTIDLTTGSAKFNGKVGIGLAPDATYYLVASSAKFTGTVYFQTLVNGSGLIIDNTGYYNSPTLRPGSTNTLDLGNTYYAYRAIFTYSLPTPSDVRFKENIRSIPSSLDLVLKLKGVKYNLKKEFAEKKLIDTTASSGPKDVYGFIAQDVQKIIPEVVMEDENNGLLAIDYVKIIPVLVEAIKEQNIKITALEAQVKQLTTKK